MPSRAACTRSAPHERATARLSPRLSDRVFRHRAPRRGSDVWDAFTSDRSYASLWTPKNRSPTAGGAGNALRRGRRGLRQLAADWGAPLRRRWRRGRSGKRRDLHSRGQSRVLAPPRAPLAHGGDDPPLLRGCRLFRFARDLMATRSTKHRPAFATTTYLSRIARVGSRVIARRHNARHSRRPNGARRVVGTARAAGVLCDGASTRHDFCPRSSRG